MSPATLETIGWGFLIAYIFNIIIFMRAPTGWISIISLGLIYALPAVCFFAAATFSSPLLFMLSLFLIGIFVFCKNFF